MCSLSMFAFTLDDSLLCAASLFSISLLLRPPTTSGTTIFDEMVSSLFSRLRKCAAPSEPLKSSAETPGCETSM